MYFLYSLGVATFNKRWITLSILNCFSPNFQGLILMKNTLTNQVGMLGDMFCHLPSKTGLWQRYTGISVQYIWCLKLFGHGWNINFNGIFLSQSSKCKKALLLLQKLFQFIVECKYIGQTVKLFYLFSNFSCIFLNPNDFFPI